MILLGYIIGERRKVKTISGSYGNELLFFFKKKEKINQK